MPLQVSYRNKDLIGYIYYTDKDNRTWKIKIHSANCLMAMCYHWTEMENGKKHKYVNLQCFLNDIDHLKNLLGIGKRKDTDWLEGYHTWVFVKDTKEIRNVAQLLVKTGKSVIFKKKIER